MRVIKQILSVSVFFCLPLVVWGAPPGSIGELMARIGYNILNPLMLLMVSVALIVFLWGLFQYLTKLDNVESRHQGAQHMIWGIVGLFIMVSVYSIIAVIKTTFFLD